MNRWFNLKLKMMENDMQTLDDIWIAGYTVFDLMEDDPIWGDIGDDKCWIESL